MNEILAYIDSLPEERKLIAQRLNHLVSEAVPELSARMWDYAGPTIGYGQFRFVTRTGREGDWFMLGLANRKTRVSLYSYGARNGVRLPIRYRPMLPGARCGQSCLSFARSESIVDDVIIELARETADFFASEYFPGFSWRTDC